MDSVKDSPYITNFDLVPPSPPRSIALDFDHTSPGPFDAFEQSQQLQQHHSQLQQNPLSSPPFAHTPSYNGSYYNSPYSQHSELDFTGDELNFDLLRELTASSGQMNDYEPSEYDAPQTNSLLMFTNDTDFMSPHFSPGHVADSHRTRGSPFDHSSPASSNGADNDANANNNGGRHSRASSVASNHPSPGAAPLSHSPQPGFHNSPRLDVASSFGNMSVHTPNWGTQPLPPTSLGPNIQGQQLPSPPMQQKPQSPPRLTMPQGIIDAQQHTAVPTINAPDGDDGMNGPSLNIVPATPVSGGGAHGRQAVPFQQTLATLTQGAELGSSMLLSSSQSDHGGASDQARSQSQSTHPSRNQSPFRFESGTNNSNNVSPVPSPRLPDNNNNNNAVASSSGNYIFPDAQSPPQSQLQSQGQGVPQRQRSNSDTWSQPYLGGAGGLQQQQQQNGLGLNVGYDYQQQQQNHQIQQQHRQQMQNFTFGGGNKIVGPGAPNNFLSPQPDMMRRSVSENPPRLGRHGQSRSEDIRLPLPSFGGPGGQAQSGPGYQSHHGQSNSIGGTASASQQQQYLFPAHGDFIQQQQQSQTPQFLHPLHLPNLMNPSSSAGSNFGSVSSSGALPPITRSLSPGHYRRASSGSSRGAEVWGTDAGLAPPATRRMSPYPSPNASPRVRYDELEVELGVGGGMDHMLGGPAAHQQQQLPHHQQHLSLGGGMSLGGGLGMSQGGLGIGGGGLGGGLGLTTEIGEPPVSAGYSEDVPITGRGAYTSHLAASVAGDGASSHGGHRRAGSSNSIAGGDGDASLMGASANQIAKQNVTTGRTMNASIRRRKQDANFVCTVPGCGSTFTRGFNLKGHLRSHYEQKPYKCHWPGCGKGFARQHDCKRHEQLHSNYRPFECEGCRKQFARMDALNRHLRSEAGAECARIVERSKGEGGGGVGALVQDPDEMEVQEDEKKPLVVSGGPRRRNTGGSGGMGEDEGWSVAL